MSWSRSADGYRVMAWTGGCPDDYVQAWADLHTAMSADVPTGGLSREPVVHTVERVRLDESRLAKNWIALNSMAVTDRDEPVGYSTLFLPRTQPEHAYQDDTLCCGRIADTTWGRGSRSPICASSRNSRR